MQLSDAGGQLATRPAPNPLVNPGWLDNAAPGIGVPTNMDADMGNAMLAEFLTIITTVAGIAFSKSDITQLAQGIQSGLLNYAADSGEANAYVAAFTVPLTARVPGRRMNVLIANSNTGNSTINFGYGALPIASQKGGVNLPPNLLLAGNTVTFIDNGTEAVIVSGGGSNGVISTGGGAGYVVFSDGYIVQAAAFGTPGGGATNGEAALPLTFPNTIVDWEVRLTSQTAPNAAAAMTAAILGASSGPTTSTSQIGWYCWNASGDATPNAFRIRAEGF
jgi:hypothetical protein